MDPALTAVATGNGIRGAGRGRNARKPREASEIRVKRGKILPVLAVCFLVLTVLLPRPAPALASADKEVRIASSTADDGTVVSPRPPRRRVQPPAAAVLFQAVPAATSGFFLPDPGSVSTAPDHVPLSIRPSTGAGVTRAGPSLLI